MSICEGLDPYTIRQKLVNTRSMRKEVVGNVFISRQIQHFLFVKILIKVIFPIFTLTWRVHMLTIMFPSKEKV